MTNQQVAIRNKELFPAMTQNKAMYLLKTIYPTAPDVEVVKAGIICLQYQLNPLMRQIYLIKYDRYKDHQKVGEDWSIVMGIGATRGMVLSDKHRVSYIDGPRVMTKEEQERINGEFDNDNIWAVIKIKDENGNEYPGYGSWPKDKSPKGTDKGNSPRHMAFIRAERDALNKLAPGRLPDVDVADDFVEVKVTPATIEQGRKELIEEADNQIDELYPPPSDTNRQRLSELEEKLRNTGNEETPRTEEALLSWLCKLKNWSNPNTARTFIVQNLKIEVERIKSEPDKVYFEVRALIRP